MVFSLLSYCCRWFRSPLSASVLSLGPKGILAERELMGRSEEGCEEQSPSWGLQKDFSQRRGAGREGGPGFVLWEEQGFEGIFSFLFHVRQQCLSPQSSWSLCYKAEISLLASLRVFQWFQGALGKAFNKEFRAQLSSCITSTFSWIELTPVHAWLLSSLAGSLRPWNMLWTQVSCALRCLSTPAARTAKPAKLQQTDRSLQQQARNATRTRLQLLSLQVKLLG